MQNLGTLRQLSLGDLADDGRERERKEKIMPSACAAPRRYSRTKCPLFLGLFFFLSSFLRHIQGASKKLRLANSTHFELQGVHLKLKKLIVYYSWLFSVICAKTYGKIVF
jgi:hypothetical protein